MAEGMGTGAWNANARFRQVVRSPCRNRGRTQRSLRSKMAEKYMPVLCLRAPVAQVLQNSIPDHRRQRITCAMSSLTFRSQKTIPFPVNVLQGEFGNLAGTKTICGQQKHNRVVSLSSRRASVYGLERSPDIP